MVDWVDGALTNPQPATAAAAVKQAQDALRVDLPPDFLSVATIHQGASPVPAVVDLPNGFSTSVGHLLHFADAPFVSNIVAAGYPLRDVSEKGFIPFALDVGGDPFCFNYRDDYDHPTVIFWSVDWGAVPLAADFGSFVAMLHD